MHLVCLHHYAFLLELHETTLTLLLFHLNDQCVVFSKQVVCTGKKSIPLIFYITIWLNRGRSNYACCVSSSDLKAFERRLTEYIACLQPATGRWRSKFDIQGMNKILFYKHFRFASVSLICACPNKNLCLQSLYGFSGMHTLCNKAVMCKPTVKIQCLPGYCSSETM